MTCFVGLISWLYTIYQIYFLTSFYVLVLLLSALVIPHLHQTKLPSSLVNFMMHIDIQID